MDKERFLVEGMSCGHCVATITKAVGAMTGVSNVNVILENKEVLVEFDGKKVRIGDIASKIQEAGFEVMR